MVPGYCRAERKHELSQNAGSRLDYLILPITKTHGDGCIQLSVRRQSRAARITHYVTTTILTTPTETPAPPADAIDPHNGFHVAFTPGHFYSPIVDPADAATQAHRLWPGAAPEILGIDFDAASHREILAVDFPKFMPDYRYPERQDAAVAEYEFFTQNSQFSWLDARALYVLLRKWQPQRIIEVGSGFSSLLMADVNRRHFGGAAHITCIEPYPREFLKAGVPGINRLIEQKVQDVALDVFAELRAGDILFIDSSHVAKTGSDVNYLFFEVLPRLAAGVRIHIHDIFLPNEYLYDWVIVENRSWNEQYLLRALLMYSTAFRVVFGCSYAFSAMPDLVRSALALPGGQAYAGGSFWIEKVQ
jgi:predicted O-methyltransferase YrrM